MLEHYYTVYIISSFPILGLIALFMLKYYRDGKDDGVVAPV